MRRGGRKGGGILCVSICLLVFPTPCRVAASSIFLNGRLGICGGDLPIWLQEEERIQLKPPIQATKYLLVRQAGHETWKSPTKIPSEITFSTFSGSRLLPVHSPTPGGSVLPPYRPQGLCGGQLRAPQAPRSIRSGTVLGGFFG